MNLFWILEKVFASNIGHVENRFSLKFSFHFKVRYSKKITLFKTKIPLVGLKKLKQSCTTYLNFLTNLF